MSWSQFPDQIFAMIAGKAFTFECICSPTLTVIKTSLTSTVIKTYLERKKKQLIYVLITQYRSSRKEYYISKGDRSFPMAETTSTIRVSNRRGIHIQAHENMLSAASEKSSMYKIQTSKARDPVNLTKSIGKRTKKKKPRTLPFYLVFFYW